jgi:hypothetical protein
MYLIHSTKRAILGLMLLGGLAAGASLAPAAHAAAIHPNLCLYSGSGLRAGHVDQSEHLRVSGTCSLPAEHATDLVHHRSTGSPYRVASNPALAHANGKRNPCPGPPHT